MKAIIFRDIITKKFTYAIVFVLMIISLNTKTSMNTNVFFYMWIFNANSMKTVNTMNVTYPLSLLKQLLSIWASSIIMFFLQMLVFIIFLNFKTYHNYFIFSFIVWMLLMLFFSLLTIFQFSKLSGIQWLILITMGSLQLFVVTRPQFYPLEKLVYSILLGFSYLVINTLMIYVRERGRYYVEN